MLGDDLHNVARDYDFGDIVYIKQHASIVERLVRIYLAIANQQLFQICSREWVRELLTSEQVVGSEGRAGKGGGRGGASLWGALSDNGRKHATAKAKAI